MNTAKVKAWTTSDYALERLIDGIQAGDVSKAIPDLFYANSNMATSGWVLVGEATITLDANNYDKLAEEQLATLEAQLAHERAESQLRQNAILDRISKLQALTFEPA